MEFSFLVIVRSRTKATELVSYNVLICVICDVLFSCSLHFPWPVLKYNFIAEECVLDFVFEFLMPKKEWCYVSSQPGSAESMTCLYMSRTEAN
jgi:hypothetical protein